MPSPKSGVILLQPVCECQQLFLLLNRKELDELLGFAAEAVDSIIAEGVEKSMTKFNRRAPGLNTEDA